MNTEQQKAMTIIKNHTADCSGGKDFILPIVQESLAFIEKELNRLDAYDDIVGAAYDAKMEAHTL